MKIINFLTKNFELLIVFFIFLWAFLYIHQSNHNTFYIKTSELKTLTIENVIYLQSLRNKSKKYPTSGIAILQENNLHNFNAHCIGVENFCHVNQITYFSEKATITLLWTKNHFDSEESNIKTGLITEIRTPKEVIFTGNDEQINRYVSLMHEKFFFGMFAEAIAFFPCIWILIKIFRTNFLIKD